MHLFGCADGELRVSAVRFAQRRAADIDAIAGLQAGDAIADLVDHAGRIGAGRVGQVGLDRVGARAHVGVVRIDADGVNADAHLSGAGDRIRNFFEFENVGTAELTREDGLHPPILLTRQLFVDDRLEVLERHRADQRRGR